MDSDIAYRQKLEKCDMEELIDICHHIDQERFPERYAMVLNRMQVLRDLFTEREARDATRKKISYSVSNEVDTHISVLTFIISRKTHWLTPETEVLQNKSQWLHLKYDKSLYLGLRKVGQMGFRSLGFFSDGCIGELEVFGNHYLLKRESFGTNLFMRIPRYSVFKGEERIGSFQYRNEADQPENFVFADCAADAWVVGIFQFQLRHQRYRSWN